MNLLPKKQKIENSVRYCDRCNRLPAEVNCGGEKVCLRCAQKEADDELYLRLTLKLTQKPERGRR